MEEVVKDVMDGKDGKGDKDAKNNKDAVGTKDPAPANDPGPANQALTTGNPQMSKNKSCQIQQTLIGGATVPSRGGWKAECYMLPRGTLYLSPTKGRLSDRQFIAPCFIIIFFFEKPTNASHSRAIVSSIDSFMPLLYLVRNKVWRFQHKALLSVDLSL
jgi:hypothetical protein